ncbi:hypothetical protein [Haloarchaeobius sp. TZWWS8]|uniref:hypothetical protein n=1 Tax=Haloarchaeobius sp. TZWWS8 TaxID=3446121 RepID=UPI003EBCC3DE
MTSSTTTTTGEGDEAAEEERESVYSNHPFTFGMWRHSEPVVDEPEETEEAADTEETGEKKPIVADGGVAVTTACPGCDAPLVNVQGVPACTECDWTAR